MVVELAAVPGCLALSRVLLGDRGRPVPEGEFLMDGHKGPADAKVGSTAAPMPAGLGAADAWPVSRDLGSALVPGVRVIADLIAAPSCDPSGVAALALAHRKAAANSTELRLVAPPRVGRSELGSRPRRSDGRQTRDSS